MLQIRNGRRVLFASWTVFCFFCIHAVHYVFFSLCNVFTSVELQVTFSMKLSVRNCLVDVESPVVTKDRSDIEYVSLFRWSSNFVDCTIM